MIQEHATDQKGSTLMSNNRTLPPVIKELITVRERSCADANSKHWFTTSFLKPLPYLVPP